jgi:hypothetical protein
MKTIKLVLVFLLGLVIVSCGGGGSSGGTATTPIISGTAASGAAIANAQITITGATGSTVTVTTDSDGLYSANVSSLTRPYLVKVVTAVATTQYPAGTTFYSVGTATGIVNIHPLTDLIVRTWYEVQGTDADTAFADPASNPPPTANEAAVIKQVVKNLVAQFLSLLGNTDPANFDFISTPFTADSTGFDHFLDNISLTLGSGKIFINAASGVAPEYEATLAVSGVNMTSTLAQDLGNTGTFTEVSTATNAISGITTSPYAGVWWVGHTTTSSNGNCGNQTLNVPQPESIIAVDSNGNFLIPDRDDMGNLTGYIQGVGHITLGGDLTAVLYGDTVAPYIGGTCPAGSISATMTDANNGSGTFSQDGGGTVTLTRVTVATAVRQFDGTYTGSSVDNYAQAQPFSFTVTNGNITSVSQVGGGNFSGTVNLSGVVSMNFGGGTCTQSVSVSFPGQATFTSSGGVTMTGTFSDPGQPPTNYPGGPCAPASGTWTATRP